MGEKLGRRHDKKIESRNQMSKKKIYVLGFASVFLLIGIFVFLFKNNAPQYSDLQGEFQAEEDVPAPAPVFFGIVLDTLVATQNEVKSGDSFGKILGEQGVETARIYQISEKIRDVFDVRKIQAGKNYTLISGKNSQKPLYFLYEQSMLKYLLIYMGDSIYATSRERELKVTEKTVSGVINSSLFETVIQQGGNLTLAVNLSDIYAWTIDFFRIQKGDSVTVVYEDLMVDDTLYAGVGKILAARFYHQNKTYHAFRFTTSDGETDYFDINGRTMRKAFLKAPLQFSRISSHFSPKRFHPVQRRWKPHLGTDYAAPTGTPIMTTADGVIESAGYTSGNGNYVKVKHNSTYSTQYLHMSKIGKGIKPGVRVRQGDVIGYVGSTGLATGPHVCYRFWKNGVQVDALKEKLPEAKELDKANKAALDKLIETRYPKLLD